MAGLTMQTGYGVLTRAATQKRQDACQDIAALVGSLQHLSDKIKAGYVNELARCDTKAIKDKLINDTEKVYGILLNNAKKIYHTLDNAALLHLKSIDIASFMQREANKAVDGLNKYLTKAVGQLHSDVFFSTIHNTDIEKKITIIHEAIGEMRDLCIKRINDACYSYKD